MADPDELDGETLDRLLAAPPGRFTELRDEIAADLKKRGDAKAAAAVKRVRKPVTAVYAANALARRRPAVLGAFLDAFERVRKTQLDLLARKQEPRALREATEAEHAAVRDVIKAIPDAAREAGLEPKGDLVSSALDIVRAAARQEDARALLRAGRLVEPPGAAADEPFAALLGGAAPTDAELRVLEKAASAAAPVPHAAPNPAPGPVAKAAPAPAPPAKAEPEAEERARAEREAAAREKKLAALRAAAAKAHEVAERAETAARAALAAADRAESQAAEAREAADAAAARVREAEAPG